MLRRSVTIVLLRLIDTMTLSIRLFCSSMLTSETNSTKCQEPRTLRNETQLNAEDDIDEIEAIDYQVLKTRVETQPKNQLATKLKN
ncbi:hypothetical protein SDJN03_08703, partial [Cucurbita argyrosperma subsp. sororia]